jgi:hypothetical protein
MRFEKLTSLVSRGFFLVAFILLAVAVVERAVNVFGYTIMRGMYPGGRVLEFAALFLVFVIALQLREMREVLRSGRPAGSS